MSGLGNRGQIMIIEDSPLKKQADNQPILELKSKSLTVMRNNWIVAMDLIPSHFTIRKHPPKFTL